MYTLFGMNKSSRSSAINMFIDSNFIIVETLKMSILDSFSSFLKRKGKLQKKNGKLLSSKYFYQKYEYYY